LKEADKIEVVQKGNAKEPYALVRCADVFSLIDRAFKEVFVDKEDKVKQND
jgi:rRNA processing protein Gar1